MVTGRARVTIVGALLTLSACRGQSTNPKPIDAGSAGDGRSGSAGTGMEGGAPHETGGSTAVGGAGTPAAGGSENGGSGGTSGFGGGAGSGNEAGVAGNAAGAGGAVPELPGANDREREILAPLATDDATIDAATGGDLIALGRAIGAARGYAMCRCAHSPDMPPADVEELLRGCASDETGLRELARPDEARCIEEGVVVLPAAADYLRCRIKLVRDDAPQWVSRCSDPDFPWVPTGTCMPSAEAEMLFQRCWGALYCADGASVQGGRCDGTLECSDQSDELGCFAHVGYDWFWCESELMHPFDVCREGTCGIEKTPPVCDPGRPSVYLCDDRSEVSVELVCNRAADCPDGSDERYCFK
jgi:hypothetical protein